MPPGGGAQVDENRVNMESLAWENSLSSFTQTWNLKTEVCLTANEDASRFSTRVAEHT